jgi:predicted nucleic acid-binding protein
MKRVILDTNVYGLLAIEQKRLELVGRIKSPKFPAVIYGLGIIRNELRATPRNLKIGERGLRIDLLALYDSIVEEHNLNFDEKSQKIAESYFRAYKELGGLRERREIINDFCIVASASLNNLNIVVSNDEKTMMAENSTRAYNLVNSVISKPMPKFMNYLEFKNLLGGNSYELF